MAASDSQELERKRRLRNRNWAMLAVLVALFVLFYVMTLVQFGGGGAS
tara:strand:- start:249 stop:392 length:144 start_codon:yes stop_codon:yes gene_type:complete